MGFTHGHALLIGVGTHQHEPHLDHQAMVEDALAIYSVLRDDEACGYPADQVTILRHETATKREILAQLGNLAQKVTAEDTVIIFFCGHGTINKDGNYCFITYNTYKTGGKVVSKSALSAAELTDAVNAIKAKKLLLVFNACHSGHITATLSDTESQEKPIKSQNPPQNELNALLGSGEGRVIIVASKKKQFSVIGSGPTTIFTTALVEGLEGESVRNNGGFIDIFDLYRKIYKDVKYEAGRLNYNQEPLLTCLDIAGAFPVALYRGAEADSLSADYQPESIPADTNIKQIRPEKAREANQTIIKIGNVGNNSAIAAGHGATAVASRGVVIKGNVSNSVINTGNMGDKKNNQ